MKTYNHLFLPEYQSDLNKQRNQNKRFGFKFPEGRDKTTFGYNNLKKADEIVNNYKKLQKKYKNNINVNLIYKIKINQNVNINSFDKHILSSMGMEVLSVSKNGKGYWVVFSSEEALENFKYKLSQYSGIINGAKYNFFNAIDGIDDIPPEEKIGKSLREKPLLLNEQEYLNIELWRTEDNILNKFIEELKNTYSKNYCFRICDKLITSSFALLRVKLNKQILDEILQLKEVAYVDRPFYSSFRPQEINWTNLADFNIIPPNENAAGILVIDSGILSNHPILSEAVAAEENYQEGEKEFYDTVGHGTAVAGCAVFGDINECLKNKEFKASNWLYSAKVMYKDKSNFNQAIFDPEKLLEHQLKDIIIDFLDNNNYNIKVVNISFGSSNDIWDYTSDRQFPLAALIDEIAFEHPNVVFIVSAGNQNPGNLFNNISEIVDNYPNYLLDNPSCRIINPATSALSLSIGSIASSYKLMDDGYTDQDIWYPIAQVDEPSPFTRAGYGVNDMIKPELVEYGGNLILNETFGKIRENPGGKIPLLYNKPFESKAFTFDFGTSFSASKVANTVGKVANEFPNKSANYIKNLIMLSASYPENLDSNKFPKDAILRTIGFGVPNFFRAVYSSDNRVILINEGEIGLNKIKVFAVNIPEIFFETKGYKKITVVLTYNPPTKSTRGDSYIGNRLNFKLYHTIDPNELIRKFAEMDLDEEIEEDIEIPEIKQYEIKMEPGPNKRVLGCHQKAWKEFIKQGRKIVKPPISLVLINTNKWIKDLDYKQSYTISLMLEHKEDIGLYNLIRNEVKQRIKV
jgi:hypothetical protein